MSRVSVIIPNYNCGRWLESTVMSCIEESSVLLEVIVVDDFSTDNSKIILGDLVNKYSDKVRFVKNSTKGANNARNLGYSYARGEYIQWLDADDQILNGKLKSQVLFLDQNPHIDVVYSDWCLDTLDERGNILRHENMDNLPQSDMIKALLENRWSAQHVYLLRRRIADKLHKIMAWNPETKVAQDREYFTLAALQGAIFGYLPGRFARYNRWSESSISFSNRSSRCKYLWKIFERFETELRVLSSGFNHSYDLKLYSSLIYTNYLMCAALEKDLAKNLYSKSFKKVHWFMVKGIRTRIKVARLYLTHILYSNSKLISGTNAEKRSLR